jgi:hypothetical protein
MLIDKTVYMYTGPRPQDAETHLLLLLQFCVSNYCPLTLALKNCDLQPGDGDTKKEK